MYLRLKDLIQCHFDTVYVKRCDLTDPVVNSM